MEELASALKRMVERILLFLRQTDRKLLVVIGCGVIAAVLFGILFGKIFRPDYPESAWEYLPRYSEDGTPSSLQQQQGSLTVEERTLDIVPGKLTGEPAPGKKLSGEGLQPAVVSRKSLRGLRVLRGALGGGEQFGRTAGEVTSDPRETTIQGYQEAYGDDWPREIKKDIIFDMQNKSPELFNLNWGEFGDFIGELERMPDAEKDELLQEKLRER